MLVTAKRTFQLPQGSRNRVHRVVAYQRPQSEKNVIHVRVVFSGVGDLAFDSY